MASDPDPRPVSATPVGGSADPETTQAELLADVSLAEGAVSNRRATVETVLSGFVAQGAILVSGVLAARMLGPEDRGELALFWFAALALVQLTMLGLPLSATYWIARRGENARSVVRTITPLALIQCLGTCALLAVALSLLVVDRDDYVRTAAYVSILATPGVFAHQYALAVLLGQHRYGAFNAYRVLSPILYACGVALVFALGDGTLVSVTAVWSGTAVAAGVAAAAATARGLPPSGPLHPPAGPMVKWGFRGFLGANLPSDSFGVDHAVVGLFVSPAALGLYVVGVSFTNLLRLTAQNIGLVAFPRVSAGPTAHDRRRRMWWFASVYLGLGGLIVTVLEICIPWLLPLLFGTEFEDSVPLTRILLIGAFLTGLRRVLSDGARGTGRPGLGSLAELASWLALAAGLPVLTINEGVHGVAWALVLSGAAGLLTVLAGIARPPSSDPADDRSSSA